jgi:hypothetical protein
MKLATLFPFSFLRGLPLLALSLLTSCGGSSSTTTSSGITLTNAYAIAYKNATWGSGVTVTFTGDCTMTIAASGTPYYHASYYLTPVTNGGAVVATTPSGIQLSVSPYAGSGLSTSDKVVSATFNVCPTKAPSTTAASNGAIGFIASGTVLFDPYEATQTVALADNASYTFTTAGTTYTASFIDTCNQHTTNGGPGGGSGSTWHYHGTPTCWTSVIDGASGPSHIIGIALDGFPIYGGRDINGNVVSTSSLDACNGITSATPEFPSGAYHYVLPITSPGTAVTTVQSSISCYAGTVNATLSASMKKLGCKMPMQLANGKMRLPDGREVSRPEAAQWLTRTMPGMNTGNTTAATASAPAMPAKAGKPPVLMPGL